MRLVRPATPLLLLLLAACASQPVQTARQTTRDNIGGAMTAPLSDFNLIRSKIPLVLREAGEDPYARPSPLGCETLGVELARLNDVLGPDVDIHKDPQSRTTRSANFAAKSAVSAVKDFTEGWIPMRSWIRYMTGAERHSSAVRNAIEAGQIRRAYLKGLAQSEGCRSLGPVAGPFSFPAPTTTPSTVQ